MKDKIKYKILLRKECEFSDGEKEQIDKEEQVILANNDFLTNNSPSWYGIEGDGVRPLIFETLEDAKNEIKNQHEKIIQYEKMFINPVRNPMKKRWDLIEEQSQSIKFSSTDFMEGKEYGHILLNNKKGIYKLILIYEIAEYDDGGKYI